MLVPALIEWSISFLTFLKELILQFIFSLTKENKDLVGYQVLKAKKEYSIYIIYICAKAPPYLEKKLSLSLTDAVIQHVNFSYFKFVWYSQFRIFLFESAHFTYLQCMSFSWDDNERAPRAGAIYDEKCKYETLLKINRAEYR